MLKQCCLATRCSIRFSNLLYPFEPSFSPAPPKSTSRILNNSNLLEMSTSGRQQRNKREVNNKYRSEIWHTHTRNIYTQINYLCKCASSIHKCKCDDITAFELWQQRKLSQCQGVVSPANNSWQAASASSRILTNSESWSHAWKIPRVMLMLHSLDTGSSQKRIQSFINSRMKPAHTVRDCIWM